MESSVRYTGGDYVGQNPGWHVADSAWKARHVLAALNGWQPTTVCEVGCGAGEILRQLHDSSSVERLVGYEIAPVALDMARQRATDRLSFRLQEAEEDPETFDLMLIMDVIEHVPDPIGFLSSLRFKARRTMVHIPLDLSVQSILRPKKLMSVRRRVGHIHYFTPETAVATLEDAGYRVTDMRFTQTFDRPPKSLKARIVRGPRRILPRSVTVRTLGGYSLLVTAEN